MTIPIVQERNRETGEPKIGKCPCGELVDLSGFTNTCGCGRDYNWNGSELAPRECWGEETGEHWTDVIHADGPGW